MGGIHASTRLSTFAIAVAAIAVEARALVEQAVVIHDQTCCDITMQFDFGLNLITVTACYEHQRGRRAR